MKSAVIHIIIAFLVCAAALIAHGILYSFIAEKSVLAVALQNQIDAKNEKASRTASSRASLATIAGEEAVVNGYFVSESDVVSFIDNLQQRGVSQGATVKVLSVSTGNANMRPALILAITIMGPFDAVMRTAGAIEYAPYALAFSKLSLAKNDKKIWTANAELVAGSMPIKP